MAEEEEEALDVLVVQSKVKKFIRENGEMNTSAETIIVLSQAIQKLCMRGIESAKNDKRKTVMARDIIIDHL
jgi:histone H3/H4